MINDLFLDILFIIALILSAFLVIFLIFGMVIGIIDICNTIKSKKKYYLIKYKCFFEYEMIIKAQSPLKARVKFQKKYPKYDFISIEEIEDE